MNRSNTAATTPNPALIAALRARLPDARVITDELRRLSWGSDASFYRMLPQVVVVVDDEAEVAHVLQVARQHQMHLTFRAAGTSLSGQAVTDGMLVLLGDGFATYAQDDDAPEQERPQLERHGFEIVDKRSGKEVYLDGSWAEMFQQKILAWQLNTPTQEEVEDTLDTYTGLAQTPVVVH